MKKRRPNPRLAKIHSNYTVDEIANLFSIHKNTVRQWIKRGLPICDDKRPMLILGKDLYSYLYKERNKNKQKCKPGEIYCVRCRTTKTPAGEMADYQKLTETQGNLLGICPTCDSMIYRRVNLEKLDAVKGNLEVNLPQASQHITDTNKSSLNSDFN